jgi:flagellar protein FliO/FliZ
MVFLSTLLLGVVEDSVRAGQPPPTAAIDGPKVAASRPFPRRGAAGRPAEGMAEKSGSWWFGTAGIALALALFGGISLASRRYLPQAGSGGFLSVVGRASLSPKHSVYLLRVGARVLILGAGSQGAPTLLGELSEPADLERFAPKRPGRAAPEAEPEPSAGSEVRGFDRLVGDEA